MGCRVRAFVIELRDVRFGMWGRSLKKRALGASVFPQLSYMPGPPL